jgi:hypothetical protein
MSEMKPKTKPKELSPKLTAGFVADLQAAWGEHGKEILDKLRADAPTKFAEILGRLAVAERLSPTETIDFNQAKSMAEIGVKLLQSIGFSEPDENSIQAAIKANNDFIAKLEAIRDCASAPEDEVH